MPALAAPALKESPVCLYVSLQDLFDRPNFEFVRHDITEPFRAEVDQIYNMACPASPVHYQYNPIKTTKVWHKPVYLLTVGACRAMQCLAWCRQPHRYVHATTIAALLWVSL